jgi:hypothetical protein
VRLVRIGALPWRRLPATSTSTRICCANGCASYRAIRSMPFPAMAR